MSEALSIIALAKAKAGGAPHGKKPYYSAGTTTFENLPAPTAANLNGVYNVENAFVTDSRFAEGSGIECPAGTDVACFNAGTTESPVYMYDIYAGGLTDLMISKIITGTSFTLTDACDGHLQGLKVKGATDSTSAKSVGENGLTITSTNGTKTTSATITTGMPLRAYSETVYDELDMLSGTVITRCGFEDETVTELATPIVTPLTSAEMSALTALETYSGITNISITDSPTTTIDYLRDTDNGQAAADMQVNILSAVSAISPEQHRMIFRGKYLGSSVTAEQLAAIRDGSFRDLFVGDYWIINNVTWRIADINYYINTGDGSYRLTKPHLVIAPDGGLVINGSNLVKMNSSATVYGGYVGSEMHTTSIPEALTQINAAFGSDNIIEHRQFLTNAVVNGKPSAAAWYSVKTALISEINMYGTNIYSDAVSNGVQMQSPMFDTIDRSQYALFMIAPKFQITVTAWLRDIASYEQFAYASALGRAAADSANIAYMCRPYFLLG